MINTVDSSDVAAMTAARASRVASTKRGKAGSLFDEDESTSSIETGSSNETEDAAETVNALHQEWEGATNESINQHNALVEASLEKVVNSVGKFTLDIVQKAKEALHKYMSRHSTMMNALMANMLKNMNTQCMAAGFKLQGIN